MTKFTNMDIQVLKHTCSMLELTDPEGYVWDMRDKKEFLKNIERLLSNKNYAALDCKNYSIIYNCTNRSRYKKLRKFGFKHVFTYTGVDTVKVLILDVNQAEKPWYKRLFNI